jgi:hypothetical protein
MFFVPSGSMELLMVEQDECARRQGRDDQECQMGLMVPEEWVGCFGVGWIVVETEVTN